MKTSHHFLAVLLAVLLCLSLTACGDSSDDVTGDDWRASGVVAAEGTITHEGEGSVKVLVTVGPESAAFYRDEPEQELFDSVSFPVTVEDANDDGTGFDISFDDITGDGESDVVVTFQHADMSTTQMVWFWDADERYVFEPDYSCFHENGVQTDLTDTPYFSDNGLQINAAVNTGTYLLENGVACYSGLGQGQLILCLKDFSQFVLHLFPEIDMVLCREIGRQLIGVMADLVHRIAVLVIAGMGAFDVCHRLRQLVFQRCVVLVHPQQVRILRGVGGAG